ncbi:MAG: IPT/TIG domain-containing protein [Treponema sp.]|jgi:hypothetical protein|nr:IPT/TIG domain-containing protein [Treponema sp.]
MKKISEIKWLYFSLCSLSFALFLGCQPQAPVIHSIYPQIGIMGEPLTIYGAFFGKDRDESYVTIAGAQPTGKSYISWRDDEISLRIPEFGEAGLVYVHVKGRKSNGALFANKAALPVRNDGAGAGPRIISAFPQPGAPVAGSPRGRRGH